MKINPRDIKVVKMNKTFLKVIHENGRETIFHVTGSGCFLWQGVVKAYKDDTSNNVDAAFNYYCIQVKEFH